MIIRVSLYILNLLHSIFKCVHTCIFSDVSEYRNIGYIATFHIMYYVSTLYSMEVCLLRCHFNRLGGELSKLCQLDSLPIIDGADDQTSVQLAESTMMAGETCSFWAISDPDTTDTPIPLPMWMRGSLDKAVLQWRDAASKREARIAKRELEKGTNTLTPALQKSYDEWLLHGSTVNIVLDKTRKAQVSNVGAKSSWWLKKHCLLLVVHMSDDPACLRVTTGAGKQWRLHLLEHCALVSDEVPPEVDHFKGLYGFTSWAMRHPHSCSRVQYSTVSNFTVQLSTAR